MWGNPLSPPLSTHKRAVARPQDKRTADALHADWRGAHDAEALGGKRTCRRNGPQDRPPSMLTPPDSRDTRLEQRYGLGTSGAGRARTRHVRHHSDMCDLMNSPTAARHRRNASVTSGMVPIRDTPHNPFIEGGPADAGFTGPHRESARTRTVSAPHKQNGQTAYVLYV